MKFAVDPIVSFYIEKPLAVPVLIISGERDDIEDGVNHLPLIDLFSSPTTRQHPGGESLGLNSECSMGY